MNLQQNINLEFYFIFYDNNRCEIHISDMYIDLMFVFIQPREYTTQGQYVK